jgi:hypothetical protein
MNWHNVETAQQARDALAVVNRYGSPSDEVSMTVSRGELEKGYVEVAATYGNLLAQVLRRCGSRLVAHQLDARTRSGRIRVDARAFRSLAYAFKPVGQGSDPQVASLIDELAGRGGKWDEINLTVCPELVEATGQIPVWATHGAYAAELLRRAGAGLLGYDLNTDVDGGMCIHMWFRENVFRSLPYAFKPVDVKSTPMSEEQKTRLRALNER